MESTLAQACAALERHGMKPELKGDGQRRIRGVATLEDAGGMWGGVFSSPAHATLCGTPQLLVQTRTVLAGVDPATGAVFWQHPVTSFRGMNILTPTALGDEIFTSSYGGGSFIFARRPKEWWWRKPLFLVASCAIVLAIAFILAVVR